jgi:hypothetical protein
MSNFQRVGATSNAHAGREFQDLVEDFLRRQDLNLEREFAIPIGLKLDPLDRFLIGVASRGGASRRPIQPRTANDAALH